jgi:hypothetical protein
MASSPSRATWQPLLLEEFLADIEYQRLQPIQYYCGDIGRVTKFLVEIGQEKDPIELVDTRYITLATSGLFASYTLIIVLNYHFRDKETFYTKRFA